MIFPLIAAFVLNVLIVLTAYCTEVPYAQASHETTISDQKKQDGDRSSILQEKLTLDNVEKGFKIAAYIIGALWVYFNYFKGRTYRPRLETKLSGSLISKKSAKFAKLDIVIKNVGLSKVDIKQEGTALRLLIYHSPENPWVHQETVSILKAHQWIEPGETVEEHVLLPVHAKVLAVRVEAIIVSKKTMWESDAILMEPQEVKS